jgi:cell division septation protein DedD
MAAPAPAAASEAPVMPTPSTSPPATETPKAEGYVVQLGAFTDNYGANALANRLKKAGYPAFTEPVETKRGTLWRVRVGGYPTRPAAVEARNRLKADGHDGVVAAAK